MESLKIINLDYKNPVVSGQLDKSNSLQQLKGLKNSIELCLSKKFDALITLPIHKKILSSKKINFLVTQNILQMLVVLKAMK